MKKLLIVFMFPVSAFAVNVPEFKHKDPIIYREFENVGNEIQKTRSDVADIFSSTTTNAVIVTNMAQSESTFFFDNFDRSDRLLLGDESPTGHTWDFNGTGATLANITNGVYVTSVNARGYIDYGSQIPKISCAFSFSPSTSGTTDYSFKSLAMIMDTQNLGLVDMLHLNWGVNAWDLSIWVGGSFTTVVQGSYNLARDGTVYSWSFEVDGTSVTLRPPQGPVVVYSSATISSYTYRYGAWQNQGYGGGNFPRAAYHAVSMGRAVSEANRALGGGKPQNDRDYPYLSITSATVTQAIAVSTISSLTGNASIVISNDGEITQPLQPSFLVYLSTTAADVTGDTNAYTIIFTQERYDQGSNFDLATSVFTAPITGRYDLELCVTYAGLTTATTQKEIRILTSNLLHESFELHANANGDLFSDCVAVVTDMDANDTATAVARVSNGTRVVDISGGGTLVTFFSGTLSN